MKVISPSVVGGDYTAAHTPEVAWVGSPIQGPLRQLAPKDKEAKWGYVRHPP